MRWRKRPSDSDWSRVQAHWTVDGESRSYRPTFYASRRAAEQAAAEMSETLGHFPTLDIVITTATAEEAAAAQAEAGAALDAGRRAPMHLMLDPAGKVTACGKTGNWSTLDFWDMGNAPKCPTCDAIAAQQSGDRPDSI
jgi:hypothetical protein